MIKSKIIIFAVLLTLVMDLLGGCKYLKRAEQTLPESPSEVRTEFTEYQEQTEASVIVTEEIIEETTQPTETEPKETAPATIYEERDHSSVSAKPEKEDNVPTQTTPTETQPAPTQNGNTWIPDENETERDE